MGGLDQILRGSGTDLGGLAQQFGLSPEQAQSAMGALMPAVLGGMHKQEQAGGLDQVTAQAAQAPAADTDTGNGILGQIFGGKDVSRQVADHAAGQSGVPAGVLKAMLPVVAAMVARHAAQQGGGLGGLLGQVLGGAGAQAGGGGLGGLGGLAGMLGGGGNPLDAILGQR